MREAEMIWILCLLMGWSSNVEGWYLCHEGPLYLQYVASEGQCYYDFDDPEGGQRSAHAEKVVIVPYLGLVDCLSGPLASANDDCAMFYDVDSDGSVTLRDVAILLTKGMK